MKEIYGIKKVESKGQEKSYWTRIGIAHENKDGSLNCYFDYLPSNGNITVQIRNKKEKQDGNEKENVDF